MTAPGDPGNAPMPGHDAGGLAHLCLAILTAVVVGLASGFFLRRPGERGEITVTNGRLSGDTRARPLRPAGQALLKSVCVLRV